MLRTLSARLYASLALSAFIIALSVGITFWQVTSLSRLEQQSERSEEVLRKADLLLFYQCYSIASYRGFLQDQDRYTESFQESLESETALLSELRTLLTDDPKSMEKLTAWNLVYERWHKKAQSMMEEFQKSGTKATLVASFSIKDHLLPAFEALMNRERDKAAQRQALALAAREGTQRYALLGALIAMAAGGALMAWTIRGVKRELEGAISTSTAASSEIAATLTQQERSLAEQASAINEVATTTSELNTTTTQASQNGEAIGRRSADASTAARQMGEVVKRGLDEMSGLKDKVDSIARQILELSEQTSQIGSILTSVSDIAGQTNLLALNAAVEAARAGEHGRGFAVVAAEIRKLADQSKKALERINALVGQIQKATNATVMAAEEGGKRVEATIHQAAESGAAIQSLLGSLEETVLNTQQIVLNLRQQTLGVSQINEAVNNINLGMKETVMGVNQVKVGLQNLGEMGRNLKNMM
jgi:methyl-accepting chemotaxis protein